MPARLFNNPDPMAMPTPRLPSSLEMSNHATSLRFRVHERGGMEHEAEAVVDLRALGKGVCWALTIEATGGLCLFAAWHLLIFLR